MVLGHIWIWLGVYSLGVYSLGVYNLAQRDLELSTQSLGLGVYSLGVYTPAHSTLPPHNLALTNPPLAPFHYN